MNNKKIYLLIIVIMIGDVWLAFSEDWQTVRNDSVRIFFRAGNSSLAEDVLVKTDLILNELTVLFKLTHSGETNIFLAQNEEVWLQLTQKKVPDWSQGITKPETGVVYLFIKPETGKDVTTVLRHELVHVLLGKNFAPGKIPRWFEEGTAMIFARENFSEYANVLSRANLTRSLLTLEQIEEVIKFQRSKATLAYAESYLALKMIVDAAGWGIFGEIFLLFQNQPNWNSVFQSVLQMDKDQFQDRLFDQIEKKYKWNFIFQAETIIWIIIPFIAIFVFLVIRFRNYQTYRRWEHEDVENLDNLKKNE